MDWCLSAADDAVLWSLRQEIRSYLRRHAEPGAELFDAELVVEELISNAARHAGGTFWVSLSWRGVNPTLRVYDLGPGFDPALVPAPRQPWLGDDALDDVLTGATEGPGPAPVERPVGADGAVGGAHELDDVQQLLEGGRGLFLASHLTGSLQARARTHGGMVVAAVLPVKKLGIESHDPPRRTVGALPLHAEADADGAFGREPFLRALVVQLARTLETQHGPDAAEAAVAQVAADVGGRMEEEYRLVEGIVGRLTPAQVGDCYVRLKHALDGGFVVQEANERRIVLTNDRCPFGDVVQAAPSLCRMTSSVFGGIAARNADGPVAVLLEERIALGDPGCRVVVYLSEPPEELSDLVHVYGAAPT